MCTAVWCRGFWRDLIAETLGASCLLAERDFCEREQFDDKERGEHDDRDGEAEGGDDGDVA
jgi:hypothetical protein